MSSSTKHDPVLAPLDEPELEDRMLRNLRKVTRAVDVYSRKLARTHELTGPQLVCLRELKAGELSPSRLARDVSLSHATVTGILRRLQAKSLVQVAPSAVDRRSKTVQITQAGLELVQAAPSPLQEQFARRLRQLPWANQVLLHVALEQIVEMMGAEDLEAAPVFATGPLTAPAEAVEELLDPPALDPPTDDVGDLGANVESKNDGS